MPGELTNNGANYSCGCLYYALALLLGLASLVPWVSQVVAVILTILGTISVGSAHKIALRKWMQRRLEARHDNDR